MTTYGSMATRMPLSARRMGEKFGKRIRSFLTEGIWWDVAQTARAAVGEDKVWEFMLAGLEDDDLEPGDREFARSLNWSVSREEIDLSNVATYSYPGGDWWYVDAEEVAPGYEDATLVVWAPLEITLREERTDPFVKRKAESFGHAMIREDWFVGVEADVVPSKTDSKVVTGFVAVRPPDC